MNKFLAKIFLLFVLLLNLVPAASAQSRSTWEIREMNSEIKVNTDSSLDITETIVADFSKSPYTKHGFIRFIPISYNNQYMQRLNLRFSLDKITDEKGNPINFEKGSEGDYVTMKIGDANVDVKGQILTYIIKYQLLRGINQFEGHDELYWNATGLDWDAPILKSTTTVKLPKPVGKEQLLTKCYTGAAYSTEENCTIKIIDGQTIQYTANSVLPEGSGISIVAGFPQGIVSFPETWTIISWFLLDNWGYLIPLLTLIICYWLWHKHGRDPEALKSTIMPEYEAPDKLSPAEVGTLIDDKIDTQDITSTIIDLATKGYLIISETTEKQFIWDTTTYTLEKTTPKTESTLKDFESYLYEKVFDGKDKVTLDDLKYKFYKHIPTIREKIYKDLINQKYYAMNPETVRNSYAGVGIAGMFITVFFLSSMIPNLSLLIGLFLSFLIILIFSRIMPRKTQKGADTLVRILGLEEFIKTAETDRLKFYEKENIFEKILPYAIALGIADKWAKACAGIFKEAPSWYHGPTGMTNFNTIYFLNSLNSFNRTLGSNMSAAPRSSAAGGSSGFGGGGFSGGGFGGGGGRSW